MKRRGQESRYYSLGVENGSARGFSMGNITGLEAIACCIPGDSLLHPRYCTRLALAMDETTILHHLFYDHYKYGNCKREITTATMARIKPKLLSLIQSIAQKRNHNHVKSPPS